MTDVQSSLTAPSELKEHEHSAVTHPSLGDAETTAAMSTLVNKTSITKFAKVERRFADPPIPGQTYCLHSFIPAKGAQPNEDGIYGMMKIRGTFSSIREADERSEQLIRKHDSYHKIYMGYVGKPLPVTEESKYSAEVSEIDIKEQVSKIVREDVRAKRETERQQVQEIRERERSLRDDVEKEANDPYEKYTCLRVKKAQVIWGYMEHRKKLVEMQDVFDKTLQEIAEMDDEDSDYAAKYLQRYKDARERAGIPDDKNDVSFMKYLNNDVQDLDEYVRREEEKERVAQEAGNESDYKVSRNSGSTITVTRVEHPVPEDDESGVTP